MAKKILIHYLSLTSLRDDVGIKMLVTFFLQLYFEKNKNNDSNILNVNYTQQDIADILGVHRTTIARALHTLKMMNILEYKSRHEIIINNLDYLKNLLND